MKLIGFTLIVISSAICGICFVSEKDERISELNSFCRMLELLQAELNTNFTPLPQLAESLALKLSGKASAFLKTLYLNLSLLGEKQFSCIWCESLNTASKTLTASELELLCSLGPVLGRYDISSQNEVISASLCELRKNYSIEKEKLPQAKKLSLGLSVSSGAFIAIFLI